jgi:hypothetical protein
VKVAICPAVTVWLAGCVVIVGGTKTDNVAAALATLPIELLTTTENCSPSSEALAVGVV